ncbi:hypothetical protein FACS1894147_06250 [Spirochaetia bacterium]|nr:hypothetical protein FACS1894147_06250 [Spirochaetia bacterium]
MNYKRLLCWVDADMKERIRQEYKDIQTYFASGFDDFCLNLRSDDQIIISASRFDDLDTSGFVYKVADFIKTIPEQMFHIFGYDKDYTSGLSVGVLSREKNVISHQIFPNYRHTIQYHIDVWTKDKAIPHSQRDSLVYKKV